MRRRQKHKSMSTYENLPPPSRFDALTTHVERHRVSSCARERGARRVCSSVVLGTTSTSPSAGTAAVHERAWQEDARKRSRLSWMKVRNRLGTVRCRQREADHTRLR